MPLKQIRVRETELAGHCRGRLPTFAAAVRAHAIMDGDFLVIDVQEWYALVRAHRLHGPPCPSRGLGDVVESLVKPIARTLGMKCLDAHGKLRPESKCAQRKSALNRLVPKV
jgi:hypothetical protein